MRLVLIRHGRPDEDDTERPHDPPLRADGWRQARAVARLLQRQGITRPLMRARQTAEPLARQLRLPIDTVDGWAEADRHLGRYRSTETLRGLGDEQWQRFMQDPVRFLGGERIVHFRPDYGSITRLQVRDARAFGVVSVNEGGHHAWPDVQAA